ncbi:MAG: hypothetical protein ACXU9L_06865 [Thermodesulfobacteriota bacterium]
MPSYLPDSPATGRQVRRRGSLLATRLPDGQGQAGVRERIFPLKNRTKKIMVGREHE